MSLEEIKQELGLIKKQLGPIKEELREIKQQLEGINNENQTISKDILWGEYQELRKNARHNETLRGNMTNYILALTSGLITIITLDDVINKSDQPILILISLIGLLSTTFALSYAERYQRNREQADQLLKKIDDLFKIDTSTSEDEVSPMEGVFKFKEKIIKKVHEDKVYRFANKINTHVLWIILPFTVLISGLLLLLSTFD